MRESDTMGGGDDFHERLARSKMGKQRRQAAKTVCGGFIKWERTGAGVVSNIEMIKNLGKGSMVHRGLPPCRASLLSLFPRPSTNILMLLRHLF